MAHHADEALERRAWTTHNFAALFDRDGALHPTYMIASSLIAAGMSWWQALITIALGNLIVLIPMLLNVHPPTRYGTPVPGVERMATTRCAWR